MMIESVQMQHHLTTYNSCKCTIREMNTRERGKKVTGTKMIFVLSRFSVPFDLWMQCDAVRREGARECEHKLMQHQAIDG